MSTDSIGAFEEVFYKKFKYRAVNPLENQLQCLDVVIKTEQTLAQRIRSNFFSRMRPLMRLGSMLDVKLMAEESNWRSAEANPNLDRMRKGLADLENPLKTRSPHREYQKKKLLSRFNFSFAASKGIALWLAGVTGIDLSKEKSLSCTINGLTNTSIEYTTICHWVKDRDWYPNISFLEMISSDWSKDRSRPRKLWIVTEVLYATEFIVTGVEGFARRVMVHASSGVPGLSLDAGADIGIRYINDKTLELKAERGKQFPVGYRTMRVEYNPDGSVALLRKAEDTGLREDDDDPYELNLAEMGENISEVDEDGENFLIPLLTPTEQELHNFRSRVADSGDSEAVFASTS